MDIQLVAGSGVVTVNDKVFDADYNESLIHQILVAFLAGARAGTKAQKTRSQVSGGGVKPWRQKGTGRARAGTIRSPIWRGGGVTFAATPRDFAQKVNKKMYRGALRSIFSQLWRENHLTVCEQIDLSSHKTKDFLQFVRDNKLSSDLLIITDGNNGNNLFLATRNVKNISAIDIKAINPLVLLRHSHVLADKAAIAKINEWLS